MSKKLLEKIFSVKNDKDRKHKVVNMLGTKIKFKKLNIKEKIDYFKIMNDKSLYVGIPDDITLQLCFNDNCNCNCKFCAADIVKDYNQRSIMPDKWLYEDFLPLYPKTNHIVPTYGEITVCKEGYDYLSFINKNYPQINISIETNGISFTDKWIDLATENLMRVHFSINAINEEYFKKTVWEQDGIYPKIINNLDNYIKKLDEKGLGAFRPCVSMVLNNTNYETMLDFIKMSLNKQLQIIVLFFDTGLCLTEENKKKINDCFITLLELERILKDKVYLNFRLFVPINNVKELDEIANRASIEDLKQKYSDILKITENLKTLKDLFYERTEIRNKFGKKPYTYYEELTGVTCHQKIHEGKSICANADNHIRLYPNGQYAVCSWRQYDNNINKFIKNNKIDWKAFFNSYYYRKLRKNFKNFCYKDCLINCPAAEKISEKDFNKKYSI